MYLSFKTNEGQGLGIHWIAVFMTKLSPMLDFNINNVDFHILRTGFGWLFEPYWWYSRLFWQENLETQSGIHGVQDEKNWNHLCARLGRFFVLHLMKPLWFHDYIEG